MCPTKNINPLCSVSKPTTRKFQKGDVNIKHTEHKLDFEMTLLDYRVDCCCLDLRSSWNDQNHATSDVSVVTRYVIESNRGRARAIVNTRAIQRPTTLRI